MDKKIQQAFNEVQAEKELKERTKQCLHMQRTQTPPRRTGALRYATAALMLTTFIIIGIFNRSVDAQASYIRLEGDISVGLSLDDNDTVLEVHGLNEQGEQLLKDINLEGLSYREAVNRILDCRQKLTGPVPTTPTSVTVEGEDPQKCHRLQAEVSKQCSSHEKKHNSGQNTSGPNTSNSTAETDTNSGTGHHSSGSGNKGGKKHGTEGSGHRGSDHYSRKRDHQ